MVTKREFARVVKHPLDHAFSISNIKAGFAKCEIYPFNPNAIAKNKMFPSAVHQVVGSTSDSCSDCPEDSVSASSSESPSCPSSPSPSTTTQEIVSAASTGVLHTPSVTAADTGSVSSPITSTVTSGRFLL